MRFVLICAFALVVICVPARGQGTIVDPTCVDEPTLSRQNACTVERQRPTTSAQTEEAKSDSNLVWYLIAGGALIGMILSIRRPRRRARSASPEELASAALRFVDEEVAAGRMTSPEAADRRLEILGGINGTPARPTPDPPSDRER